MQDADKTKEKLLEEMTHLRQQNAVLEVKAREQLHIEDELRQSEERFRNLIEGSLQGILIHHDGHILFVNQTYANIFGYEMPDDLLRLDSPVRLIAPHERERLVRYRDARLAGGSPPSHYEYQGLRQDGKLIWLDMRARVTQWNGQLVTQSTVVDITERKQHEEALRQSEERYRQLVEGSLQGISVFTLEGTRLFANRALATMLSYDHPASLISKPAGAHLHPHEAKRQEGYRQDRLQGKPVPSRYKIEGVKRDGTPILMEQLISPITWENEPALLVTSLDITERERVQEALQASEERLKLTLDATSDGIWDCNLITGEVLFSPNWFTSLGYDVGELPPHATSWEKIVHPDDWPRVQEALEAHFAGQTLVYECENRLLTKAGTYRWNLDRGKVVTRDNDGKPLRMVGTDTDITQRKRLEEQLQQAQKMEAIGTLASGIAHEFNNILTGIFNYAYLIRHHAAFGSEVWADAQEILSAGHRAKDLVEQILTFSRQHDVELQPIHLKGIVQDALRFLRASLPTTIEIRPHLAPEVGTVLANATQVYQVLLNLCTNAAHAMGEIGGVLEVRLASMHLEKMLTDSHPPIAPGTYVCLSVRDTGSGILPEVREHMFEPFFTTKAVGQGTGMGLSIVYGIVSGYQGGITVESTLGKGTTFSIYLPGVSASPPETDDLSTPIFEATGHILLVDDDVLFTHSTERLLTTMGYEVSACTSVQGALSAFRAAPSRFDIVVTDQIMPGTTGQQFARALRDIQSDIPIIFCTGVPYLLEPHQAPSLGIDAFCAKPVSERDLSAILQQVLAQRGVWRRAAGTRILLIDDEAAVRIGLRRLLETSGYEVMEAANGREGLRKYREAPSDVIITDLFMPEQEGLETIRMLRQDTPDAKIIAISGGMRNVKFDMLHAAKQLGAQKILTKPIEREALLGAVRGVLEC